MLENVQKVDKMSFCPAKMAINTVKMAYLRGLKISCNFVSYIYWPNGKERRTGSG